MIATAFKGFPAFVFLYLANMPPELLFADINSIRRYELTTGVNDVLVKNLTRIVALDFDVRAGTIFFTDVTENKIYKTRYASLLGVVPQVSLYVVTQVSLDIPILQLN